MSNLLWIAIILIILVMIIGLIGARRVPDKVLNGRIGRLILKNTTVGDRLCEIFYGVAMVTVVSGMVNYGFSGNNDLGIDLLIIALGVNIAWGIIDGATSVYGGLVDEAEEDRLVNSLRTEKNNQEQRGNVAEILEGTILRSISDEERSKVVDMVAAGKPEKIRGYGASGDDFQMFMAIFLMDFITVFPVIIPLYIVDDPQKALFWSHLIAILLFVIIGMTWAKYLNKNMMKAGLAMGVLAIVTVSVTYYFGW